ncbi:xanthine dehydrogenase family protein molybdopterin-binding subunit [Planotetraspora sp. A-T 1434]|uniref:xanthine dehydrogenase family protein molybdopterin-binding subunit n=1 Tax=Planotetraspora sp. A-T 1434 TaxID=2979219 RepID=UPI0021BE75EA|nr:xanthine dehydrogenase family protein molybdopterin-binding subunit [Planotetraspora sp. A-T 1434]MCT9933153.1 xanthine dehydrogenase family protein molybdopterin-binding subunit [Planotetraspora sp. A-T 1434]
MSLIGQPVRRVEDRRLLTSGGTYTADLAVPGCLHLVLVRSARAHARVSVGTARAAALDGVVTVLTGDDVDVPPVPPEVGTINQAMPQPLLAGQVVRYVGEPVAAVVATTAAVAADAAALVEVGYEDLPVVVDPAESAGGGVLLHPDAGTNVALKLTFARPPGRADIFAGCEVVVSLRMVNQRLSAAPLETRGGVARWDDGRLTYRAGGQAAHLWREKLAATLGVAEESVRVVTPDVGGAFGAKAFPGLEDILTAWTARRLGRPVRWAETRSENLVAGGHGRAQVQEATLGGTRDGRLLAYELNVLQDVGAYPRIAAVLPFWTRTMLTGPYRIAKARFTAQCVVTNTAPVGSYRGAGQPEAVAALERMVDRFAAEIGCDPAELRRRNLIDEFPHTALTRAAYDSGDYHALLDRLLAASGYAGLRAEQARRRESGHPLQLGVGLSVFAEMTGADARPEHATAAWDGTRFEVWAGTGCTGQGHETAWAMLAADVLGVPVDMVDVRQGDTDALAAGGGTGGSRSLQTGGLAVREAALALLDRAREHLPWADVPPMRAEATYTPSGGTCSSGAHLAVVEVDTETGRVHVRRIVAVDDAGTILNPLLAEGQIHGGLAQGVGQALTEEVSYAGDGRPLHPTLAHYGFITAAELPSFETVTLETPAPGNPLGVKGLGESGAVGVPPAVQNAVVDALAHLGVRHLDMPATPEKVWRSLEAGT